MTKREKALGIYERLERERTELKAGELASARHLIPRISTERLNKPNLAGASLLWALLALAAQAVLSRHR